MEGVLKPTQVIGDARILAMDNARVLATRAAEEAYIASNKNCVVNVATKEYRPLMLEWRPDCGYGTVGVTITLADSRTILVLGGSFENCNIRMPTR